MSKKLNILFVIGQLDFADHISISYLSAMAKEKGHKTFFCSLSDHNFLKMVSELSPDVIAYSANILTFERLVKANNDAKKLCDFVSIMGGPQSTFSPETFNISGMDAFCVGEGEYAFKDFLECLEKKEPFDDIDNLITKQKINPIRQLIRNLDELPPADRDLTISNSKLKYTSKKTFYTTRGCPYKCAYCCNNYYHKLYKDKGPIVRRFSVERIIKEIEDVRSKHRMEFIKFGDDLFAMRVDDWLEEFVDKYSKRIKLPFNCYLRFDTVDDNLLKLLKKAGCYSVHLSVDSTSKHIRDKILNRKMRDVDIVSQLRLIRSYGINTWVNYMLAVPESTLEDDISSLELNRKADVTYASYSVTVPIEKTELYDYCVNNRLIDPSLHVGDMTGCSQRPTMSCFSEKEKDIRYNIFLLGAFISKLPYPLYELSKFAIKKIPPNSFFRKIREYYYQYNIKNKIFKLSD